MSKEQCFGDHRYFVADVAVVEPEGKVCVLLVCTGCADPQMKTFQVTSAAGDFHLLKQKEKQTNVSI